MLGNGTSPIEPNGPNQDGVGLSDPSVSSERRRMLDLMNRLHSSGAQLDIDLPMIAVIGSQSAGKSSLIESISGITLPRASGTCTRCPTECRLAWSAQPWKCVVSLRFMTDAKGTPLGQVRNVTFGEPIFDKALVEERIRRAQRAILNPSTNVERFLEGSDEDPRTSVSGEPLTFSTNCVSLQIDGPDVADLSFVDLPGLIASVGGNGNENDIELVKHLVKTYISKPSCIILLTVACETDFENQGAHRLTKEHDPQGKRTIGVLTKPDRIPRGEEENWIRFIKNDREPLDNGWYSVKQPDSAALKGGITWTQAREKEREFYQLNTPWSELDVTYQHRLGVPNLTKRLSEVLSSLIARRLPELQDELQKLLQATRDSLNQLPKPPSLDPLREVLDVVSEFSRDLAQHFIGTPDRDGFLQSIRPSTVTFRKTIRDTAPRFIPFTKAACRKDASLLESFDLKPEFLHAEDGDEDEDHDGNGIYIDEVMTRAEEAITRELPNHVPFVVYEYYIVEVVKRWRIPVQNLFDAVERQLLLHVKNKVTQHFEKFNHGGLQQNIQTVANDFIKQRSEETMSRALWLLELEKRPRTSNNHYYMDYRGKFLSHYRASRQADSHGGLLTKIKNYSAMSQGFRRVSTPDDPVNALRNAMGSLAELGFQGLSPPDLARLLPADPFENALDIMASVRAYFQVAYKRFADNVPNAIDHELTLSLDRDRSLYNAILKGLGITGPEGFQRCKEFLAEPPNIVLRREELQKKVERLEAAKRELLNIWTS